MRSLAGILSWFVQLCAGVRENGGVTAVLSSDLNVPSTADARLASGDPDRDPSAKFIKGRTVILVVLAITLFFLAIDFVSARHNRSVDRQKIRDAIVLVDVLRVAETWTRLPDGMTLIKHAVPSSDADAVTIIRRTMKNARIQFLRGDYSVIGSGPKDIPGRANLEYGSSNGLLNVRYREVPAGAELHWITTDSVMLDSLDEWGSRIATAKFPPKAKKMVP